MTLPTISRRTLLVVGVFTALVVGGLSLGWSMRHAEMEARQKATLAQLDRLATDAPLEDWLPYTAMVRMPMVVSRAQDRIRARAYLTFDLVGCLRRDGAPMRALALDFVRSGGLPPLRVESIPDAREALDAEVATMRGRIEAHPDTPIATFDPECLEAVFLAARYPNHQAAFVKPLRDMHAVIDQLPQAKPVAAGQEELERWLRLNDPSGSR